MSNRNAYRIPFAKFPAVRLTLLLIVGIGMGKVFSGGLYYALGVMGLSVAGFVLFRWLNRSSLSQSLTRLDTLLFMLVVISFGWFRMAVKVPPEPTITEQTLLISDWDKLQMAGKVVAISKNKLGKFRADVEIRETVISPALRSEESFRVRLLIDAPYKPTLGDDISFKGTLIPVSGPRNPGQFDYKSYLQDRGIAVQVRLDTVVSVQEDDRLLSFSAWQQKALRTIDRLYYEESASLAKALLVGYKLDLEGEDRQAFARAGLSHIMAVSGLHVGFVVAPFWIIIPLFWRKNLGKWIGLLVLIAVLYAYSGITGFTPSVVRASVTAVFLTIGKLFHKAPGSINLTAFAALVMLIYNPADLFNIGFQLSFSAVFIILLILPTIQHGLPSWLQYRWYAQPLMVVIVSLVVQFGLYPIQVFYFGEVSVVSPLANALFIPFLGILVPLGFLSLFIASLRATLATMVAVPFDLFLRAMNNFVYQISAYDWAWQSMELNSELLFPLWLGLILCIATWRIPALKWKFGLVSLSLLVAIQIHHLSREWKQSTMEVLFFDVGQGDAALIKTPNEKYLLIDAGVWRPGSNSGEQIILPYLQSAKIKKLDAVILSHPHADHIGGIRYLMEHIPIDTIYNSGFTYNSQLYASYLEEAANRNIPVQSVAAGKQILLDPSVLITILGPEGGRFNQDPNQHSVIVRLNYGDSEFLFTGDAGEDQELRLVENYGSFLNVDFLKVGHHGSKTSSQAVFLEALTPEKAVVSLGAQNKFRHPHREAIQRLGATNAQLYFTSRNGALLFSSNGETIIQKSWRN